MNSPRSPIRIIGIALLASALNAAQADDLTARMTDVLRYTGIDNVTQADATSIARLWTKAQEPGLAHADAAFRDMYLQYYKLHGRDLTARPQALDGLTQTVTMMFERGARMDLVLPPRGKPGGKYLHVEKRGNGGIPLLLISDIGVDGSKLYGSFARRQAGTYTMRIVTLPFAGSARPLPGRKDWTSPPGR